MPRGRPPIHGYSANGQTITYRTFTGMHQRCSNPNHPAYHRYGGRGIAVCPEWKDFRAFLRDMGEKPPGLTLERIDTNGNYQPGNCRWATWKEQAANRNPKPVNPNSLYGKATLAGLPYHVVYQRIRKGWTEEKALSTPVKLYATKDRLEAARQDPAP